MTVSLPAYSGSADGIIFSENERLIVSYADFSKKKDDEIAGMYIYRPDVSSKIMHYLVLEKGLKYEDLESKKARKTTIAHELLHMVDKKMDGIRGEYVQTIPKAIRFLENFVNEPSSNVDEKMNEGIIAGFQLFDHLPTNALERLLVPMDKIGELFEKKILPLYRRKLTPAGLVEDEELIADVRKIIIDDASKSHIEPSLYFKRYGEAFPYLFDKLDTLKPFRVRGARPSS
jgi:hypothetical protein